MPPPVANKRAACSSNGCRGGNKTEREPELEQPEQPEEQEEQEQEQQEQEQEQEEQQEGWRGGGRCAGVGARCRRAPPLCWAPAQLCSCRYIAYTYLTALL